MLMLISPSYPLPISKTGVSWYNPQFSAEIPNIYHLRSLIGSAKFLTLFRLFRRIIGHTPQKIDISFIGCYILDINEDIENQYLEETFHSYVLNVCVKDKIIVENRNL